MSRVLEIENCSKREKLKQGENQSQISLYWYIYITWLLHTEKEIITPTFSQSQVTYKLGRLDEEKIA